MINSKDISVVVQGAIDSKCTKKCLKSIRKYLPNAEIILSTWENSDLNGLDYDVLVENKDPGAVLVNTEYNLYNNINRQLVSTQNGLKFANRKYTLKLRTDFYLKGNRFLKFFDKFSLRDEKYACFKHRVIVSSVFSREYDKIIVKKKSKRSPSGFIRCPFCVSDFYFFGLTEDLKSYFEDTALMKAEDMNNYKFKDENIVLDTGCTFRYSPEQYFCYSFVLKYFPNIKFDDWSYWDRELCDFSKHFIFNNFIFLGICESQIYSDKHENVMLFDKRTRGLIIYKKFVKRYRQLIDKKYKPREFLIHDYLLDKFFINLKREFNIFAFNTKNFFRVLYYQFF